jgi:hypothetical protein
MEKPTSEFIRLVRENTTLIVCTNNCASLGRSLRFRYQDLGKSHLLGLFCLSA